MGGMQKHSYYLTKYLAREGIFVDVYHCVPYDQLIPSLLEGFTEEELEYIHHIPLHFPKPDKYPGHYLAESYKYSKEVYKAFKQRKIADFIYIQGFSGWALLKAKSYQLTAINFHGVEMFQKAPSLRVKLEHWLLRPAVKKNLKRADVIFSLGGHLTGIQQSISPKNQVVEMPIGIEKEWVINPEDKPQNVIRKFVFIGRYERRKGIEELQWAIQQLTRYKVKGLRYKVIGSRYKVKGSRFKAQAFEFHFIGPIPVKKVQGEGDKEQGVRYRVQGEPDTLNPKPSTLNPTSYTLNPTPYTLNPKPYTLTYHGSISDQNEIKTLLRKCDILVCPSWSEGMPTVILEAMASGCAIIATDVGAVSEEVSKDNGWLIESGNKKQLLETLKEALAISSEALKLKQKASLKKVEEFTWEVVIKKQVDVINCIVEDLKKKKK